MCLFVFGFDIILGLGIVCSVLDIKPGPYGREVSRVKFFVAILRAKASR